MKRPLPAYAPATRPLSVFAPATATSMMRMPVPVTQSLKHEHATCGTTAACHFSCNRHPPPPPLPVDCPACSFIMRITVTDFTFLRRKDLMRIAHSGTRLFSDTDISEPKIRKRKPFGFCPNLYLFHADSLPSHLAPISGKVHKVSYCTTTYSGCERRSYVKSVQA